MLSIGRPVGRGAPGLSGKAIREPDFERAALGHGLMLDQLVSVNVRLKAVGSAEAVEDDRPRSQRPEGPDHKMLQFEAAPDGAPVSQFPHCDGKCRFVALVEQTNQSRPFKLAGTLS